MERVLEPELLPFASDPRLVRQNLQDLAWINRWLGTHRVLRRLFSQIAGTDEALTVLDVGAASGDNGRAIRRSHPLAKVFSLDRSLLHLNGAPEPRLAADAFQLPFADRSFDVVLCSQFLHHFEDRDVVELLRRFHALARRCLIAVDLERHPVAYHFLPMTRHVLRWGKLGLHDGPVSVRASFKARELRSLARAAGLHKAAVREHPPWFRISLLAFC